ncbi:hypothetical protein JAAARDRAFT_208664 [Jaapia argillacea MUCL 33604]|uniref:Uncharacterized protein n=1 Tax=Jaapia argillacea MUCL 33604 TaxID=933084 RepID=A0A067PKF5_9AGAM|nr:hypothetical protein JAAARDRAFT_208664 [Jaapia argillacea MUCL 33604]
MAVLLPFSLSLSILGYLFALPYEVLAQTPPGSSICTLNSPELPTVNSKGQDLCFIAHTALGMCTGDWLWLGAFKPSTYYYTPPSGGCQCSIVIYNLVSSCGWCQGAVWELWSEWAVNCTTSQITKGIPLNATVPYPAWAYIDPTLEGSRGAFNVSNAIQVGDQPESSTASPPSSTSTVASPTTKPTISTASTVSSSSTITPSSTASPSPTAVTKTSKKGSIAGGVVVAVVSIAAACGVLMWYMRRKNRAMETDESDHESPPLPAPTPSPPAMSQKPYVYYDPNDPTTFPKSPDSSVTFQVGSPIGLYGPSTIQPGVAYSSVPFSPVSGGGPIHPVHPGLPQLG